jgi:hypothetical protein
LSEKRRFISQKVRETTRFFAIFVYFGRQLGVFDWGSGSRGQAVASQQLNSRQADKLTFYQN